MQTQQPTAASALSAALRALLPCDAQGSDQAAWARLTNGIERLTGADVQQRFAAEGVQITLDAAVQFQVDAVGERPGAVFPVVALDDKHTAPMADCDDGSKCQAAPCIGVAIVAEGGADAAAVQPLGFRLPIAKGEIFCRHDWSAKSDCGSYEISIHSNHGHKAPGITHWGFETRIDPTGRRWTHTDSRFVTDNFGDLVEVAA